MRNWRDWAAVLILVATLIAASWTLVALSVPGWNWGELLLAPMIWGALGVLWIGFAVIAFATQRVFPPGRVLLWLATPMVVIVTFVLALSDAPLRLRLEASRGALDEVAHDVGAGRREPPPDGRIGLFRVYEASRISNGLAFLVEDAGFIDPCGLAYSEEGDPRLGGASDVWHITGPWYGWCLEF